MATQKISVTLDAERLAKLRERVGARGVSAYLDEALADRMELDERQQALLDFFDELDADDPPTPERRARAKREADRIRSEVEG